MSATDVATLGVLSWALALQTVAGLLSIWAKLDEEVFSNENPYPLELERHTSKREKDVFRDNARGWFRLLYDVWITQPGHEPGDTHVVFRFRRFERPPLKLARKEIGTVQTLLRQLSLLSLAVIGLIRFASGEPILNLF